jgi:hypothetical protein
MRRITIVALSAALLTATALVVHGAAAGSTGTAEATARAAANTGPPTNERALEHGVRTTKPASLASQLATARLATARYATSLAAAKADGYQIITRMIPDMGWHYLNPTIQGFDLTKPPSWSMNATDTAGSSAPWNGSSPRPQPAHPYPAPPTDPSPPPATTATAPLWPPGSSSCAPSAAPRPGRGSTSGTRTWSPCTCGCGIPTRPASTAAPTP